MLSAADYLDDGSPIRLTVTINVDTGTARFDFTGTGHEIHGNLNAPISVVHSAIIYCMRAMVGQDIPLNAGCLLPLDSEWRGREEVDLRLDISVFQYIFPQTAF